MSGQGFPFQADALALARWDYCQSPDEVPENQSLIACALRARQCGSHIAATGNQPWSSNANAMLGGLLEPVSITGWRGSSSCVDLDVPTGVCGLLASERYGPSMWKSVGKERAEFLNRAILGAKTGQKPKPPPAQADSQIEPPVFGSTEWMMMNYYK